MKSRTLQKETSILRKIALPCPCPFRIGEPKYTHVNMLERNITNTNISLYIYIYVCVCHIYIVYNYTWPCPSLPRGRNISSTAVREKFQQRRQRVWGLRTASQHGQDIVQVYPGHYLTVSKASQACGAK